MNNGTTAILEKQSVARARNHAIPKILESLYEAEHQKNIRKNK